MARVSLLLHTADKLAKSIILYIIPKLCVKLCEIIRKGDMILNIKNANQCKFAVAYGQLASEQ
jgi:hypothetical protein